MILYFKQKSGNLTEFKNLSTSMQAQVIRSLEMQGTFMSKKDLRLACLAGAKALNTSPRVINNPTTRAGKYLRAQVMYFLRVHLCVKPMKICELFGVEYHEYHYHMRKMDKEFPIYPELEKNYQKTIKEWEKINK